MYQALCDQTCSFEMIEVLATLRVGGGPCGNLSFMDCFESVRLGMERRRWRWCALAAGSKHVS